MGAVPDVLLWVQEVGFSDRRGVHVVYGHDFRDDFRWLGGDVPSDLYAFRGRDRQVLHDIDIAKVHRFSKGWAWETSTPERLPDAPFLLTDDPQCRVAFTGWVECTPTPWAANELAALIEEFGVSPVPLFGSSWFGILAVEPSDPTRGHVLAFSREPLELVGSHEVGWAGEDAAFGLVVFPSTTGSGRA